MTLTFFINGKPDDMNSLRKLRNRPSWLLIFLVVLFNKIRLFSKDLITFVMYFISLFAIAIPEPLLDVNSLLSSFISLLT